MNMKKKTKRYAVGAVLGAVGKVGGAINAFAQPIRDNAERVDPNTGMYENFDRAANTARVGAVLNPLKAFSDPYAKTGEKILGLLGFGGPLQGKIYERKQQANRNSAFLAKNPNEVSGGYNPYYMATGGMMPGMQQAELEDGEIFKTPQGRLQEVDGRTHAEGGETFMLPEGTGILGKNVNKELQMKYKELGKKLKLYQDRLTKVTDNSKSTPIARRTAEIMLDRVQTEFDELLKTQEQEKSGQSSGSYPEGGVLTATQSPAFDPDALRQEWGDLRTNLRRSFVQNHNRTVNPTSKKMFEDQLYLLNNLDYDPNTGFSPELMLEQHFGKDIMTGAKVTKPQPSSKYATGGWINMFGQASKMLDETGQLEPITVTGKKNPFVGVPKTNYQIPNGNYMTGMFEERPKPVAAKDKFNFGEVADTLGSLSPMLYNIGQGIFGEKEQFDYTQYLNPYAGSIRSKMRGRRYNINPELEANRLAQANYQANLRGSGASPAQLYANLQAGATGRQRADSVAIANRQNMNNQYLSEEAQMDYRLGSDAARTKFAGYDINLRNKAAKKNFLSSGLSQLQQYYQIKKQMQNQKEADEMRLKILPDLLANFNYDKETGRYYFNQKEGK